MSKRFSWNEKATYLARQICPLWDARALKWMVTKCCAYSTCIRVQSLWHSNIKIEENITIIINPHNHNHLREIEDSEKKVTKIQAKRGLRWRKNGTHPSKLDKLVFLYNQLEESQQLLHIPSTPRKAKIKYGISLPTFDHYFEKRKRDISNKED